jgi:hypothetical protein
VDLQLVANGVRLMPDTFLGSTPFGVAPSFSAYALPLIGPPLLPYARLRA